MVADIVPRFRSLAALQSEFGDKHGAFIWKLGHGVCKMRFIFAHSTNVFLV
jgi:hypothetical protein